MTQLLGEVQTAALLGFQTFAQFRTARKRGSVPAPTCYIGRRSFWSAEKLQQWIDGVDRSKPCVDDILAEIDALTSDAA